MRAPVTHVLPLTTIVRERLLPVSGKVTARLNQRVSPTDVIAEANYAREHVLLDVARAFDISPDSADRLIKLKVGERVQKDALVAQSRGMIARSVRAPKDGRVAAVGGGQVLIEVGDSRIELRAGIPGVVTQIIGERGVMIRATGALIQGVWGNGRVESGLLLNLSEKPDDVLTAGRLDVSLRGSVILGGQVREAETLQAAAELPVRGLILSSILSQLAPLALQMRYPIMVTEGFGAFPMNAAAYKLLSTSIKREVTVNAEFPDRYSGARPEAIIPLPVSSEPEEPNDAVEFAEGQQVRIRRGAQTGAIAALTTLHLNPTVLPSGARAPAAEVKLENGESLLVPLANLEVVG